MGFGGILKQSTAVDILIGPFVDDSDGKTAETGLTLAQADIKLSKNGQALAQKNDATSATHDSDGYYNCELDDTDTNTCGQLAVIVHETGALPVRHDYHVVEESIYDALFAASAAGFDSSQRVNVGQWLSQAVTLSTGNKPDVNVNEISDDSTAADNAELAFDGTGYGFTGCTMPTVTTLTGHTAQTGDTYGALPSNFSDLSITVTTGRVDVASIEGSDATDQINAACDTALTDYDPPTKTEMDSAFTEIKGGTWDSGTDTLEDIRNKQTDIETDTQDLQTQIGTDGAGLTNLGGMSTSMKAEVNAECDTALTDIKLDHLIAVAESDDPVDDSIIAKMAASDGDWSGFSNTTDSLEALRDNQSAASDAALMQNTTITVSDQTEFTLASGSADDDAYNNMIALLTDQTTAEQKSVRTISDYVGATKTVTIDSAPDFTIATGDTIDIIAVAPGTTPPTAAQIADAVWDEESTGHTDAGKAGEQLWTDIDAILTDTAEIGTAGAGLTDLGGMSTSMKGEVNAEVDTALNTAIPGSPNANSINERIATMDDNYTATRAGYLDNINGHTAQTGDTYGALPSNFSDLSITVTTGRVDVASIEGSDATDQINAACDTAFTDYDPPTKAEMDSGFSGLNDPTAASIADAVWDESSTGHVDAGKAGAQLWTDVNAILSDTNELQADWTDGGRLDLIIDELTSQGDTNETKLDTIITDTNELQTDWTDGGRLDLLVDGIKTKTDNLQFEAGTNYIQSVPQDLEDIAIGDGDSLSADTPGEVLRWLRWFIKNTWDVDTTPDPDEMNIYKDDDTTKGYCFQVYTSSNHNYRKVVACS